MLRKLLLLLIILSFISCNPSQSVEPTIFIKESSIPSITFIPTPTHNDTLPTPSPFSYPYFVWFADDVPQFARKLILQNSSFTETSAFENASLVFEIGIPEDENQILAGYLVYVVAVAFPELKLSESVKNVQDIWKGRAGTTLLVSPETYQVLTSLWGTSTSRTVQVMEETSMLDFAWKTPGALAILPFDHISPRWRALPVDGTLPFDAEFHPQNYALSVPVRLVKRTSIPLYWQENGFFTHYQKDHLTLLAMTGVTALSRRTAQRMNEKGILYPSQEIGTFLSSADITHISNEVSFNPECTPEKAQLKEALFCSPPEYIQLLESVGTDVVELTGNHNLDRGVEAYRYSLTLYKERGWKIFGGGDSQSQAIQPLIIDNHGNRIAFLGCNQAGPEIAWAGEHSPGAARCDLSWMEDEVSSLRSQGILPVVTFQSVETEDYRPAPMQRPGDYLRMAQAGAVIVSGSQSHVPQGFSFVGENLIHYGLGNLFFDQTDSYLTSQAFIDWHVFYQGKYLGVRLVPVRIEDYSRPRFMAPDEALLLLKNVFEVSLW